MRFEALAKILAGEGVGIYYTLGDDEMPYVYQNSVYMPAKWEKAVLDDKYEDELFVYLFHELQHVRNNKKTSFLSAKSNNAYDNSDATTKYPAEFFELVSNALLDCRDDALGFKTHVGAPKVYARFYNEIIDELAKHNPDELSDAEKAKLAVSMTMIAYKKKSTPEFESVDAKKLFDRFPELAKIARDKKIYNEINKFVNLEKNKMRGVENRSYRQHRYSDALGEASYSLANKLYESLKDLLVPPPPPQPQPEQESDENVDDPGQTNENKNENENEGNGEGDEQNDDESDSESNSDDEPDKEGNDSDDENEANSDDESDSESGESNESDNENADSEPCESESQSGDSENESDDESSEGASEGDDSESEGKRGEPEFDWEGFGKDDSTGFSTGFGALKKLADEAFEYEEQETLSDTLRRIFELEKRSDEIVKLNTNHLTAYEHDPDYLFDNETETKRQQDWVVALVVDLSGSMGWFTDDKNGEQTRRIEHVKSAAVEINAGINQVNELTQSEHEFIVVGYEGIEVRKDHGYRHLKLHEDGSRVVEEWLTEVQNMPEPNELLETYILKRANDNSKTWANAIETSGGGTSPAQGIETLKLALEQNPIHDKRLLVLLLTDGMFNDDDLRQIEWSRQDLPDDHTYVLIEMMVERAQHGDYFIKTMSEFPDVLEEAIANTLIES